MFVYLLMLVYISLFSFASAFILSHMIAVLVFWFFAMLVIVADHVPHPYHKHSALFDTKTIVYSMARCTTTTQISVASYTQPNVCCVNGAAPLHARRRERENPVFSSESHRIRSTSKLKDRAKKSSSRSALFLMWIKSDLETILRLCAKINRKKCDRRRGEMLKIIFSCTFREWNSKAISYSDARRARRGMCSWRSDKFRVGKGDCKW